MRRYNRVAVNGHVGQERSVSPRKQNSVSWKSISRSQYCAHIYRRLALGITNISTKRPNAVILEVDTVYPDTTEEEDM